MSGKIEQDLSGVAETLLIPLYFRALESQRVDALMQDEQAVALISKMNYDFSRITKLHIGEDDKVALVLRNREFDRYGRDFLSRHPRAVIVHIGCGLDSRFKRVDNGQVEWYDLDLPEVIELRQTLVGGEGARYHLLKYSILDGAWRDAVSVHRQRPFLFLAEGVLMYLKEEQVKSLVLSLREHFPGAELVFDAESPLLVWGNNRRIARSKIGAQHRWGLKHGKDLESWGEDISMLQEWHYLDHPEPRLAHMRWIRFFPFLAKAAGIYHYRLGRA